VTGKLHIILYKLERLIKTNPRKRFRMRLIGKIHLTLN